MGQIISKTPSVLTFWITVYTVVYVRVAVRCQRAVVIIAPEVRRYVTGLITTIIPDGTTFLPWTTGIPWPRLGCNSTRHACTLTRRQS